MAEPKDILDKLKKVSDATNPFHWVEKAVNPLESQDSAREKVAGNDPKKGKHYNEENYKFAQSAAVELSHQGTFTKGFIEGFVDGVTGANLMRDDLDHRAYHRDVRDIVQNGGSHAEYSKFKKAAGDPIKSAEDGTPKQPKLDVTIPDYADFCKTAAKSENREALVKDTIQDLKSGKTLKQSTKEIENGGEAKPEKSSTKSRFGPRADAESDIEQQKAGSNTEMDQALAKVDMSKLKMSHNHDALGAPTENLTTGVGGQAQVQTNIVQV